MDESQQTAKTATRTPAELVESYGRIGRVLLVAEAAETSAGIPWLPPTPRAVALRTEYYSPLSDFVRHSLVGIGTSDLEFYAEDLGALEPDEASAAQLNIGGLSALERYMLTLLLFCSCFAVFFVLTLWVRGGLSLALGLSFLVATVVAGVSAYVCSERSRRATFQWVICEELLRRKGMDIPGATPIALTPLQAAANLAASES